MGSAGKPRPEQGQIREQGLVRPFMIPGWAAWSGRVTGRPDKWLLLVRTSVRVDKQNSAYDPAFLSLLHLEACYVLGASLKTVEVGSCPGA